MDAYWKLIISALIIIISYLFGLLSKRTNIPSVIMLVFLGYGLKEVSELIWHVQYDLFPYLEVLGIVGVIMIVLDGSLDLKLTKDKTQLIIKSFVAAVLLMLFCAITLAWVFQQFIQNLPYDIALLYSLPLSVLSSAIVIPSVEHLPEEKREFLIYESTFSDILGIMAFFFLLGSITTTSTIPTGVIVSVNVLVTIVVSVVISLTLIILLQKITSQLKLFLFVAILVLLYSVGKLFHFSSLMMILIFGLAMANPNLFFVGKLKQFLSMEKVVLLAREFRILTIETSFLIRTFFFVVFGASLSLSGLFSLNVIMQSVIALLIMFGSRYLLLKLLYKGSVEPTIWIAPRGLISVLLFFSIPVELQVFEFDSGILFFIVIITSIIMSWGLIRNARKGNVVVNSIDETI